MACLAVALLLPSGLIDAAEAGRAARSAEELAADAVVAALRFELVELELEVARDWTATIELPIGGLGVVRDVERDVWVGLVPARVRDGVAGELEIGIFEVAEREGQPVRGKRIGVVSVVDGIASYTTIGDGIFVGLSGELIEEKAVPWRECAIVCGGRSVSGLGVTMTCGSCRDRR